MRVASPVPLHAADGNCAAHKWKLCCCGKFCRVPVGQRGHNCVLWELLHTWEGTGTQLTQGSLAAVVRRSGQITCGARGALPAVRLLLHGIRYSLYVTCDAHLSRVGSNSLVPATWPVNFLVALCRQSLFQNRVAIHQTDHRKSLLYECCLRSWGALRHCIGYW